VHVSPENDAHSALERSRRLAWLFAAASWLVTAAVLAALLLLIPLKQAVPYIVQQDAETGALRVLRAVDTGPLTQQEALVQYHLVQYVQAREGYDHAGFQEAIDTVYVMSAPRAREEFLAKVAEGHPDNPLGRYGERASVDVAVKSVSFVDESTASVRFSTELREPAGITRSHWVALVRFRFVRSPAAQEVRFKNPLGFQVTAYRRSHEVVDDTTRR